MRIRNGTGNSSFDGLGGEDILILQYDFESSTFGFDTEGYLLISNGSQTDRARNIEKFDFSDAFKTYEELLAEAFPPQDVTLFAGDYYVGTTAVDLSPEGGGGQFLFATDHNNGGNNTNNSYVFRIAEGAPGKAEPIHLRIFTGTV